LVDDEYGVGHELEKDSRGGRGRELKVEGQKQKAKRFSTGVAEGSTEGTEEEQGAMRLDRKTHP
jgi:hypothetical protein